MLEPVYVAQILGNRLCFVSDIAADMTIRYQTVRFCTQTKIMQIFINTKQG